jgi:hypothetical protein
MLTPAVGCWRRFTRVVDSIACHMHFTALRLSPMAPTCCVCVMWCSWCGSPQGQDVCSIKAVLHSSDNVAVAARQAMQLTPLFSS